MTNEYKIIKEKNQTRFVLEMSSAGGVTVTGGGSIATAIKSEESEQIKTRNPGVPALAKKTGSGAHKKKTGYQRRPKHQKPFAEDSDTNLKFANYIRAMFVKLTGVDPNSEEEDPDYRMEPEAAMEIIAGRLSEKFPLFQDEEGNPDVNAVRNFLSQHSNFKEDFREPDHEISMAKNELRLIYTSAKELFELIKHYSEMEGLEAWQQSKITKAADYLHSVLQSLSGDAAEKDVAEDLTGKNQLRELGSQTVANYVDRAVNEPQTPQRRAGLKRALNRAPNLTLIDKPGWFDPNDVKGLQRFLQMLYWKMNHGEASKQERDAAIELDNLIKGLEIGKVADKGVAEGIDGSNDFYAFAELFSHPNEYSHPDPEEAVRLITVQGQKPEITASNIIKFAKFNPDELGNSAVANAVKSLMSQGVAEGLRIPKVKDPETGKEHPDYGNTGMMRDLAAAAQRRKSQTPSEPTKSDPNDLSKYNDFPDTNKHPWMPVMIGEPSWANIPKSLEIWARRKGIHRDIDISHDPEGKIWTIKGKSGYPHDTEYTYSWKYDYDDNQFKPVEQGVAESDISGLTTAAELAKDFIITAKVDGKKKQFRVRGVLGPNAAQERFLKHHSMAKVLDVKPIEEENEVKKITPEVYRAVRKLLGQLQIDLTPNHPKYQEIVDVIVGEIGKLHNRAQQSNLEIGEVAEEKIKGVDGKACWKGKRYAGRVKKADGTYKDKCVPVGEDTYTETLLSKLDQLVNEKAPPGAKYKRMAKHIKASYKGSGLDKDEIAQRAFGATWKAAKQAKK